MENGWWRGGGRRRKLILLALFSPLLLPLICVSCPLICIAIFCLRFQPTPAPTSTPSGHQPPRRCDESAVAGPFERGGLLQRYLQDQLDLVRSIYNCDESNENDDGGVRLNLFP